MRKLFSFLFAVFLTMCLAVPGFAVEADLVLSDAEAKPGDTVYLTLSLQTQLAGDAMGLSFSYDEKVLEPLPAQSWSWSVKSAIKNFDIKKNRAVWGSNETTQLEGDICVMAFRMLEKAKLTRTKVTCELIVKNQGTEVGTYTAQCVVGQPCEHEYSPWDGQDILFHSATCKICGLERTQSHDWDDGTQTTVDGKNVMRFSCHICHRSRDVELTGEGEKETVPTKPTTPQNTPTVPNVDFEPNHEHEEDIWNTIPASDNVHEDHDHVNSDEDSQTIPNDDHENPGVSDDETHDHIHEEPVIKNNDPATGYVIVFAVVIMLGGAILFVKKR